MPQQNALLYFVLLDNKMRGITETFYFSKAAMITSFSVCNTASWMLYFSDNEFAVKQKMLSQMDPKRSQNSFPEKFHMMAYRIRLKNANKFLTILMPVHLFFLFSQLRPASCGAIPYYQRPNSHSQLVAMATVAQIQRISHLWSFSNQRGVGGHRCPLCSAKSLSKQLQGRGRWDKWRDTKRQTNEQTFTALSLEIC